MQNIWITLVMSLLALNLLSKKSVPLPDQQQAIDDTIATAKEKLAIEIELKNEQLKQNDLLLDKKNKRLQHIHYLISEAKQAADPQKAKKLGRQLGELVDYDIHPERDWKLFCKMFEQAYPGFHKNIKQT